MRRVLCGTVALTLWVTSVPAVPFAWADSAVPTPPRSSPTTSGLPDLSSLSVPDTLGRVVETWQPNDGVPNGFVVHLQDLHVHPEAQQHLSSLIGLLRDRLGIDLVTLEGAEGVCNTSLYSDLPDPESTEHVARLFMQEGLFTGAEYYAITHPGRVTLWGVEDEDIYLRHLHAYQTEAASRSEDEATVAALRGALKPLVFSRYPVALQNFARRRDAYERDESNAFEPYLHALTRLARAHAVDLRPYPRVRAALRAYAFYRRLNLRAVARDRERLLQALRPQLTPEERLRLRDAASRDPGGSAQPYDLVLAEKARAHHVPVRYRSFHALRGYLGYLRASDTLRAAELSDELSLLDEAVETASLSTASQRTPARLLRRLGLIDALIHAKLSAKELAAYRAVRSSLTAEDFWRDVADSLPSSVTQHDVEQLIRSLSSYERFYDLALERDDTLATRTLAKLRAGERHAVILVAGGFHTPGITQRLRAQRIAYAVIAPTITTPLDDARYQARLQLAIPPLDALVSQLDRQALVPPLATDVGSPTHQRLSAEYFAAKFHELAKRGKAKVEELRTWINDPANAKVVALNSLALTWESGKVILSALGMDIPFDDHGTLLAMSVGGGVVSSEPPDEPSKNFQERLEAMAQRHLDQWIHRTGGRAWEDLLSATSSSLEPHAESMAEEILAQSKHEKVGLLAAIEERITRLEQQVVDTKPDEKVLLRLVLRNIRRKTSGSPRRNFLGTIVRTVGVIAVSGPVASLIAQSAKKPHRLTLNELFRMYLEEMEAKAPPPPLGWTQSKIQELQIEQQRASATSEERSQEQQISEREQLKLSDQIEDELALHRWENEGGRILVEAEGVDRGVAASIEGRRSGAGKIISMLAAVAALPALLLAGYAAFRGLLALSGVEGPTHLTASSLFGFALLPPSALQWLWQQVTRLVAWVRGTAENQAIRISGEQGIRVETLSGGRASAGSDQWPPETTSRPQWPTPQLDQPTFQPSSSSSFSTANHTPTTNKARIATVTTTINHSRVTPENLKIKSPPKAAATSTRIRFLDSELMNRWRAFVNTGRRVVMSSSSVAHPVADVNAPNTSVRAWINNNLPLWLVGLWTVAALGFALTAILPLYGIAWLGATPDGAVLATIGMVGGAGGSVPEEVPPGAALATPGTRAWTEEKVSSAAAAVVAARPILEHTRVGLTGITGSLGTPFSERLARRAGNVVLGLTRNPTTRRARALLDHSSSPSLQTGDLFDGDALARLIQASDVIYHFGAWARVGPEPPLESLLALNAGATAMIVQLAKENGKRVVFSSSGAVYGLGMHQDRLQTEAQDPELPEELERLVADAAKAFEDLARSPALFNAERAIAVARTVVAAHTPLPPIPDRYALSKLIAERIALNYDRAVVLRLWHVYGPGDETDRRIPTLIRELTNPAHAAEPLSVVPEQIAFTDLGTALDALEAAGAVPLTPDQRVINVAGKDLVDLVTVAQTVKSLTASPRPIVVRRGGQRLPPFRLSNERAERLLQISSIRPSLETGLRETVAWFRTTLHTPSHPRPTVLSPFERQLDQLKTDLASGAVRPRPLKHVVIVAENAQRGSLLQTGLLDLELSGAEVETVPDLEAGLQRITAGIQGQPVDLLILDAQGVTETLAVVRTVEDLRRQEASSGSAPAFVILASSNLSEAFAPLPFSTTANLEPAGLGPATVSIPDVGSSSAQAQQCLERFAQTIQAAASAPPEAAPADRSENREPQGTTRRAPLGTVRCGVDELAVEEVVSQERGGTIHRLEFFRTDRPRQAGASPDLMIYGVNDQLRGVYVDPDLEGRGRLRFLVNQFLTRYPQVRQTHPNVENYVLLSLLMREYGFGAPGVAITFLRWEPVTLGDSRLQKTIFQVARPQQPSEDVACVRGMASGHPLSIPLTVQDARALEQALVTPPSPRPALRTLEVPEPIAAQIASWEARGGAPHPLHTVLMVEDEPEVRSLYEAFFHRFAPGASIVGVASAEDALQHLEAGERFDLVILDHVLPGMSGVEALPRLRRSDVNVAVILCSGSLLNLAVTDEQARYLHADPSLFLLPKPFGVDELKQLLAALSDSAEAGRIEPEGAGEEAQSFPNPVGRAPDAPDVEAPRTGLNRLAAVPPPAPAPAVSEPVSGLSESGGAALVTASTSPSLPDAAQLRWQIERLSAELLEVLAAGTGTVRLEASEEVAARELLRLLALWYERMGLSVAYYHNHLHNVIVTVTNLKLASAQGRIQSPRDLKLAFLAALLHDFHLRAVTAGGGKSASVAETLAQLSDILGLPLDGVGTPTEPTFFGMLGRGRTPEKDALRDAIWNLLGAEREATVSELVAMIRRTDFAQPTEPPARRDDIEHAYQEALARVPGDRRRQVDELAQTLRTADYAAFYLVLPPELLVSHIIPGLAREGVPASPEKTYDEFLKAVLLQEAHLKRLAALPEADKRAFLATVEYFARLGQAKHGSLQDWRSTTGVRVEQALGLAGWPLPPATSAAPTENASEPSAGAPEGANSGPDRNYSEILRFPELYRFLMDFAKTHRGPLAVAVLGPGYVEFGGDTFSPQLAEIAAALGPQRLRLTVVDGDRRVLEASRILVYHASPSKKVRSFLASNHQFWVELKQAMAVLFGVSPEAVQWDHRYPIAHPPSFEPIHSDFRRWAPASHTLDALISTAALAYALKELPTQTERVQLLAKLVTGLTPDGRAYLSMAEVAALLMKQSPTELAFPEDLEAFCGLLSRATGSFWSAKRIYGIVELAGRPVPLEPSSAVADSVAPPASAARPSPMGEGVPSATEGPPTQPSTPPPTVSGPPTIRLVSPDSPDSRVRQLLEKAQTTRPEPLEVATLSLKDIERGAGIEAERVRRITQSRVFQRVEHLLPYIEEIVIQLVGGLRHGHYAKVLCVGRDAEILYDATKVVLAGTPYENQVMLFPGSLDFIDFDLIRKLNSKHPDELSEMRAFFAEFGITDAFFRDNTRLLLLDSGLEGTVGKELHFIIGQLFSVPFASVQKKVDVALIGTSSGGYYGRRLMDFADRGVNWSEQGMALPSLAQSGGKTTDFYLAAAMQTLPRYHGPYAELRQLDGRLRVIPAPQAPVDDDELDRVETVNASVVHPVAALLVQRRVAEYFEEKKAEVLARGRRAPAFPQPVAASRGAAASLASSARPSVGEGVPSERERVEEQPADGRDRVEERIDRPEDIATLTLPGPITVFKGSYSPRQLSSQVFRRGIRPRPGSTVLILGGGTGADALLAVQRGASDVYVTGLTERERDNILTNVRHSPAAWRIHVLQGDLFDISELKGRTFDHIYMNPWLDHSLVMRLLGQAATYLKEDGTLEVTCIDHPLFLQQVYQNGWEPVVIQDVLAARNVEMPPPAAGAFGALNRFTAEQHGYDYGYFVLVRAAHDLSAYAAAYRRLDHALMHTEMDEWGFVLEDEQKRLHISPHNFHDQLLQKTVGTMKILAEGKARQAWVDVPNLRVDPSYAERLSYRFAAPPAGTGTVPSSTSESAPTDGGRGLPAVGLGAPKNTQFTLDGQMETGQAIMEDEAPVSLVVDIGTGAGDMAAALAKQHPQARIITLDPAPRLRQGVSLPSNVTLVKAPVQHWVAHGLTGRVDRVVWIFPNDLGAGGSWEAVAVKLAGLLKPGGRITFVSEGGDNWAEPLAQFEQGLRVSGLRIEKTSGIRFRELWKYEPLVQQSGLYGAAWLVNNATLSQSTSGVVLRAFKPWAAPNPPVLSVSGGATKAGLRTGLLLSPMPPGEEASGGLPHEPQSLSVEDWTSDLFPVAVKSASDTPAPPAARLTHVNLIEKDAYVLPPSIFRYDDGYAGRGANLVELWLQATQAFLTRQRLDRDWGVVIVPRGSLYYFYRTHGEKGEPQFAWEAFDDLDISCVFVPLSDRARAQEFADLERFRRMAQEVLTEDFVPLARQAGLVLTESTDPRGQRTVTVERRDGPGTAFHLFGADARMLRALHAQEVYLRIHPYFPTESAHEAFQALIGTFTPEELRHIRATRYSIGYQYLIDAKVWLDSGRLSPHERDETLKAVQKAARLPLLLERSSEEHDEIIQWALEHHGWGTVSLSMDQLALLRQRVEMLLERYSPLQPKVRESVGVVELTPQLLRYACPLAFAQSAIASSAPAQPPPNEIEWEREAIRVFPADPERVVAERSAIQTAQTHQLMTAERCIEAYLYLVDAKIWLSGVLWTQKELDEVLDAVENVAVLARIMEQPAPIIDRLLNVAAQCRAAHPSPTTLTEAQRAFLQGYVQYLLSTYHPIRPDIQRVIGPPRFAQPLLSFAAGSIGPDASAVRPSVSEGVPSGIEGPPANGEQGISTHEPIPPPGAVINPYLAGLNPDNIMRGLKLEDEHFFNHRVSTALDQAQTTAAKGGRQADVLVIGAGAGRIVWDIERAFPAVRVASINHPKERVIVFQSRRRSPAESFQEYLNRDWSPSEFITVNDARSFLARFWRTVQGHDADEPLPYPPRSFDVILVASSTFIYINRKDRLLAEVKRLLRVTGVGFVNGIETFHAYGQTDEAFFQSLGDEYEYVTAGSLATGLIIRNQHPDQPFPSLRLRSSESTSFAVGANIITNVYTLDAPPSPAAPPAEGVVKDVEEAMRSRDQPRRDE